MKSKKSIVYIDAENVPASKWDSISNFLTKGGKFSAHALDINIFGKSESTKGWRIKMSNLGLYPKHHDTPYKGKGKNHADVQMIIHVMEDVYTKGLKSVNLVTSDFDFEPLVSKLRGMNVFVRGFGNSLASEDRHLFDRTFASEFSEYYGVDELGRVIPFREEDASFSNVSKNARRCFSEVASLLQKNQSLGGWVTTATIASMATKEGLKPSDLNKSNWDQVFHLIDSSFDFTSLLKKPDGKSRSALLIPEERGREARDLIVRNEKLFSPKAS